MKFPGYSEEQISTQGIREEILEDYERNPTRNNRNWS
jgi:hypothetical protein